MKDKVHYHTMPVVWVTIGGGDGDIGIGKVVIKRFEEWCRNYNVEVLFRMSTNDGVFQGCVRAEDSHRVNKWLSTFATPMEESGHKPDTPNLANAQESNESGKSGHKRTGLIP